MHTAHRLVRFLDDQQRLCSWPAKHKDTLLVLAYLASRFDPTRHYSEQEVNALLNAWHTFGDHALLRRALFDYVFLDRSRDDSCYWRVPDRA